MSAPWFLRRTVRDAGRHRITLLAVAGAFASLGFSGAVTRAALRAMTEPAPRWALAVVAAMTGALALLGTGRALRSAARIDLPVLAALGFTHTAAALPLAVLATTVAALGAAGGIAAAGAGWRALTGAGALSPADGAVAVPALAACAGAVALVALRVPRVWRVAREPRRS